VREADGGESASITDREQAETAGHRLADLARSGALRRPRRMAGGGVARGHGPVDPPPPTRRSSMPSSSRGRPRGHPEAARPTSQLLLVEDVVAWSRRCERLSESFAILAGLGFQLEPFGPGSSAAAPYGRGRRTSTRSGWSATSSTASGGWRRAARRRRLAALTACHAAVRLGDRLDPREQLRLLERLVSPGRVDLPHGGRRSSSSTTAACDAPFGARPSEPSLPRRGGCAGFRCRARPHPGPRFHGSDPVAKMLPPARPAGCIARPALVERLEEVVNRRLTTVVRRPATEVNAPRLVVGEAPCPGTRPTGPTGRCPRWRAG